ncbi:MAG: mechanosensitive ion channel [Bacteroidota bacterium]|nr:mechanosensitive ion channel [Bacteroidota bacterium]MDX5430217.1 mechanosensitive ion channel [Bacteroidota bacterium]MDX5468979.1 mechanosensitive ion channel [Bacteroidota bacterium]
MPELLEVAREILNHRIFSLGDYTLHFFDILEALLILGSARFLLYLLRQFMARRIKRNLIDQRKSYAIRQIVKYIVYIIALVMVFETLGIPVTPLLFGSTALFVGLGLGLQDTFKDLVSGVVILIERTVAAGDIVEIDGIVGKVKDVGLRTTRVLTRDDIIILVPNQKLINDRVINWTQNQMPTRFFIDVVVAYGSDTRLVERLLAEQAEKHPETVAGLKPIVQFTNFGNSGLAFRLYFHCNEMFRIERVKSDIRFGIDEAFRKNGITIPFPQTDVWIRTPRNPES